jgi:hypothetical protein
MPSPGFLRQVGQVLQADALAFLAVAGGTGKVVRAAALEEQALAHLVHDAFLRVRLRQVEGHALGFGGDPGGQGRGVGALALAPAAVDDRLGVDALQGAHAGDQARLQVLHLAGVGKPARQLDEGALDHARALAQIAALQRGVLGAALLLPQVFALGLEQVGRVAVLQHFAVFLDGLDGRLLRQRAAGGRQQAEHGGRHGDGFASHRACLLVLVKRKRRAGPSRAMPAGWRCSGVRTPWPRRCGCRPCCPSRSR